jgi:V8-like Glu-specific endopeptidase
VSNTDVWPWRALVFLDRTLANGAASWCSGTLVGPDTVLTAAHCLFDRPSGGWAQRVRVVPGKRGPSTSVVDEPNGSQYAQTYEVPTEWVLHDRHRS